MCNGLALFGHCQFRRNFRCHGHQSVQSKKSLLRLLWIAVAFGFGFLFLWLAMRDIPMGTAYAVWTGLGAAGTVLMGIFVFKEPGNWKRLMFLLLIICGAVGLKIFS